MPRSPARGRRNGAPAPGMASASGDPGVSRPWIDPAILAEPHHQALELAAAEALAAGFPQSAYAFADRRCRIAPAPEAHSFVLRGEALFRLGDQEGALADLDTALAIAPDDVTANRRLIAWGRGKARETAATALIAGDTDVGILRQAIAFLRERGRTAFFSAAVLDDLIDGWAAWPRGAPLTVNMHSNDPAASVTLEPDPFHPLADEGMHATGFAIPRSRSAEPGTVVFSVGDEVACRLQAPPNEIASRRGPGCITRDKAAGVTVIVPVYADYAATKTCLDLLAEELRRSPRHRAIVVNDAAADPRFAPYLAGLADNPGIVVLANERNLGFVASVNRALDAAGSGDAILLNADTIPPRGFIDRLAKAAAQEPDIGLVAPLSNHAEFTSFPVPNVANPLGSRGESLQFDRIAMRVNAGAMIDIPSGTGFCLYVTAACRDAVGSLSASYHRGYLEDVDYCLRARAHGFRTVCDPSIFVGHVGSRSFGAEKPKLVARNFVVLQERFPDYPIECRAFALADPLRPFRTSLAAAAEKAGMRVSAAPPTETAKPRVRKGAATRPTQVRRRAALKGGDGWRLGIVATQASAGEFRRVRELALALRHLAADLPIIVLGETMDDVALMRIGNVFATGTIPRVELDRAIERHQLDALLVPAELPEEDFRDTAVPIARLGNPRREPRSGALRLDPALSAAAIAAALVTWMAGAPS